MNWPEHTRLNGRETRVGDAAGARAA